MADRECFWRLEHLSDRQLLERLQGVLRTQRCALAELVAHLGEVEERRLHLVAAHGSMFSYCVQHLGMSEDEACRRIDLSRLARRFPLLFGELASGRISLSVALLLKPVLTPANHGELIAAARGASLRTARELLATRFPSPDVPSRIRKLPDRPVTHAMPTAIADTTSALASASASVVASAMPTAIADTTSALASASVIVNAMAEAVADATSASVVANPMAAAPSAPGRKSIADIVPAHITAPSATAGVTAATSRTASPQLPRAPELEHGSLVGAQAQSLLQDLPTPAEASHTPVQACVSRHGHLRRRLEPPQRIDPLSAERYRIVFTADAGLKQKLELARDLLRHSNPGGDLAPVVSRALDLLLQELMQRRFGVRKDTSHRSARLAPRTATAAAPIAPAPTTPVTTPPVARPPGTPTLATPPPAAIPSAAVPRSLRSGDPCATNFPAAALQSSTRPLAVPAPTPPAPTPPAPTPPAPTPPAPTPPAPAPPAATPSAAAPSAPAPPAPARSAATSPATPTSHLPRAARRAVLERDGLGCCWVDPTGNRCGSTAWLELDHHHPSGKGGGCEPENLRLLCRAHNRFAAERAYGRDHVERAIQARQRSAKQRCQGGQPPSSSSAPA